MRGDRLDQERHTSTPYPEPDRWGEVDVRRAYTSDFSQIECSMRAPAFIFTMRLPDRPT